MFTLDLLNSNPNNTAIAQRLSLLKTANLLSVDLAVFDVLLICLHYRTVKGPKEEGKKVGSGRIETEINR